MEGGLHDQPRDREPRPGGHGGQDAGDADIPQDTQLGGGALAPERRKRLGQSHAGGPHEKPGHRRGQHGQSQQREDARLPPPHGRHGSLHPLTAFLP